MQRLCRMTCCSNGARLTCYPWQTCSCGNGCQAAKTPLARRAVVATLALLFFFMLIIVLHSPFFVMWPALDSSQPLAGAQSTVVKGTDLSDPTLTYAIVFDCGSSGTRVYLYCWPPHSGEPSDLLDVHPVVDDKGKPVSKKVSPGLSSYASKPAQAAEYLYPLLDLAAGMVPKEKHKQTPLYVLATAGMRLIPMELAEQVIDDIVVDIPLKYDFLFSKSHVEIISGKYEGIYAWISLNYLLGRFHHFHNEAEPSSVALYAARDRLNSSSWHARKQTVGIIDMGGGSVQIAFEVPAELDVSHHDELIADLNLGCKDTDRDHRYRLYVTTHLGFGANVATKRYRDGLVAGAMAPAALVLSSSPTVAASKVVDDPCLPLDLVEDHTITADGSTAVWSLRGTGDFAECRRRLQPLLNKTELCELRASCSVNGVFQPEIPRFWSFYGISEYWYSLHDVFDIAGSYNSHDAVKAAETFCKMPWSETLRRQASGAYPFADMDRLKSECFKVGWIMTMLHDGFRYPESNTNFMPINEINGQEVQWTLGALIFKTRYFPASAVQRSHESLSAWTVQSRMLLPYAAAVCFLVVVSAIALYCRHLRVVPAALQTVPSSMSYFASSGKDYDVEEGTSASGYKRVRNSE